MISEGNFPTTQQGDTARSGGTGSTGENDENTSIDLTMIIGIAAAVIVLGMFIICLIVRKRRRSPGNSKLSSQIVSKDKIQLYC